MVKKPVLKRVKYAQIPDYHIFIEARDGKACMLPGVFDTENMQITNPKTWPRRMGPGLSIQKLD